MLNSISHVEHLERSRNVGLLESLRVRVRVCYVLCLDPLVRRSKKNTGIVTTRVLVAMHI